MSLYNLAMSFLPTLISFVFLKCSDLKSQLDATFFMKSFLILLGIFKSLLLMLPHTMLFLKAFFKQMSSSLDYKFLRGKNKMFTFISLALDIVS